MKKTIFISLLALLPTYIFSAFNPAIVKNAIETGNVSFITNAIQKDGLTAISDLGSGWLALPYATSIEQLAIKKAELAATASALKKIGFFQRKLDLYTTQKALRNNMTITQALRKTITQDPQTQFNAMLINAIQYENMDAIKIALKLGAQLNHPTVIEKIIDADKSSLFAGLLKMINDSKIVQEAILLAQDYNKETSPAFTAIIGEYIQSFKTENINDNLRNIDTRLFDINKKLNKLKLDTTQQRFNASTLIEIKKELEALQFRFNELQQKLNSLDDSQLQELAQLQKKKTDIKTEALSLVEQLDQTNAVKADLRRFFEN